MIPRKSWPFGSPLLPDPFMQLPGTLSRTTVGDVFGRLHRGQLTGVLELVEQSGPRLGWMHRVHFHRGLVRHVESNLPVRRLGDILRQQGVLDSSIDRVVRPLLFREPTRPLGQAMIDAGLVRADLVQAALRVQLRERVDGICRLRDARLTFRVAQRTSAGPPVPLGPGDFLHGRTRFRATAECGASQQQTRAVRRSPRSRALAVLGLPEGADRKQVRAAFRRLAALHHPDRQVSRPDYDPISGMRRFAELSAAYHVLMA